MADSKINVAILGVGNCASSFVQGLQYYKSEQDENGLISDVIGGYRVSDIEVVCAFDINKSKVGKDAEYTFTTPGIYAYWCVPHKTMGMIGFVIVDNDLSNLDSIKKVKFIGKSKKIAAKLIEEIEG